MLRLILIAFCTTISVSFTTVPGHAQSGRGVITGKVLDKETGQPVPKVIVKVQALGILALTNDKGAYELLRVPVGNHSVSFSAPEYGTRTFDSITVKEGKAYPLSVTLRLSTSFCTKTDQLLAKAHQDFSAIKAEPITASRSFEQAFTWYTANTQLEGSGASYLLDAHSQYYFTTFCSAETLSHDLQSSYHDLVAKLEYCLYENEWKAVPYKSHPHLKGNVVNGTAFEGQGKYHGMQLAALIREVSEQEYVVSLELCKDDGAVKNGVKNQ